MKNGKLKKIICVGLSSMMLLSMTATAFAADGDSKVLKSYSIQEMQADPSVTFEQYDNAKLSRGSGTTYTSELQIWGNSTFTGKERTYNEPKFNFRIYNNVLGGTQGTLYVEVGEKSLWSFDVLGSGSLYLYQDGMDRSLNLGDCGAGDRAFKFDTSMELAIESSDVQMSSFN